MLLRGLLGLVVLLGLAWLLSEKKRALPLKTVFIGTGLQFALALLLLKCPPLKSLFLFLNEAALALGRATETGTSLVFGFLGGAPPPFTQTAGGSAYILAFRGLPLVLVVSALSSLLFYWRLLPAVVRGFSRLLQRFFDVGGAVGVGVAANIFVGMVEAPLLVRPYLKAMSRSELFTVMTCGMSTIAGTVLVLYAKILEQTIPHALSHILMASIISAPASIVVSQIIIPPDHQRTEGELDPGREESGAMEAITRGTMEGLQLLLNIVAMLIVLVALVSLVNQGLQWLPPLAGQTVSLQRLLGLAMAPIAWLMGIPWNEAFTAGSLLGTKTILNEFVAYLDLAALSPELLSERSRLIVTYALCGFANPGSLGIMIGGMGTMVPDRRREIVALGMKSLLAGTLATCLTGTVIGLC
ncbi:MAG: nucleoside transporter C-terminal domain-containing protein [Desulfuromonadaceae bacterium]